MEEADARLVEGARKGEEGCATALFDRYRRPVFMWALRALRNRRDADEVVQQAFRHAFRKLDRFDAGKGTFLDWVLGCAANGVRMKLRDRQRHPAPCDIETIPEDELADPRPGPAEVCEQHRLHERVHALLCRLPPEEREPVSLHYLQGMNKSEIARLLGKSEHAVRYQIHRGMERLRASLVAEGVTCSGAAL
jgi:RNA polymerase sigma-70 factor (ECF subfamily)